MFLTSNICNDEKMVSLVLLPLSLLLTLSNISCRGTVPDKWLLDNTNCRNPVNVDTVKGIVPIKCGLELNTKYSNWCKLPISYGIVPLKEQSSVTHKETWYILITNKTNKQTTKQEPKTPICKALLVPVSWIQVD